MLRFILIVSVLCFAGGIQAASPLPNDSVYQLNDLLVDQDGRPFSLAQRRGRPQLIAMFYTSCKYVCPLIIDSGLGIEHALSEDERRKLQILLVSIDPARDDPPALKRIADKRKLDLQRWTLARIEANGMRKLAALLGVRFRSLADGDFNHTSALILLDADGRILARTERLGPVADPEFLALIRGTLAKVSLPADSRADRGE